MATVAADLDYKPFFLETTAGESPILYSAFDMRRFTSAMFGGTGIIGHRSFYTAQSATVGWTVTIKAGYARVGNYLVHMAADQILSIAAFSTNPTAKRTHKVWVAVYDKASSGTEYIGRLVITEDNGTGAPVPNATAYIQIAQVSISPGQANIQKANINITYRHAGPYDDLLTADTASGIADASTSIPTAPFGTREAGGLIRFSGAVKRSNGSAFGSNNAYYLTTITGTQWPKYTRYMTAATSINASGSVYGDMTCRVSVEPDGTVTAYIPDGTSPTYILLDGATYELD